MHDRIFEKGDTVRLNFRNYADAMEAEKSKTGKKLLQLLHLNTDMVVAEVVEGGRLISLVSYGEVFFEASMFDLVSARQ